MEFLLKLMIYLKVLFGLSCHLLHGRLLPSLSALSIDQQSFGDVWTWITAKLMIQDWNGAFSLP